MANVTIHDNLPNPDDNLFIYYQQNVRVLNLQDGTMNIDNLFQLTVDPEFYLLAASEINLDTTKHYVREKIDSIKKAFPGSKGSYSSSSISATNNYKPGGVMLCSKGKINSKFIGLVGDDLGRWTGQSFLGKQFHQIHFLTIYRPCQKRLGINNRGKITSYAQQEQLQCI